ncbi:two-component system sensor histidine kinase RcsC [Pseudomonas sp. FW305-25]|nr:two-component system sensor histidine kinase RcsC [Pseudomonas sp. FW305-25]PMY68308.1 two-component system sensor histidine kinase RcsC [Pseudomonas sp. FW126-L8]PNA75393.1 two-component system sensor histidine kinase RcsC [Pseudomonas sp. FW305-76]
MCLSRCSPPGNQPNRLLLSKQLGYLGYEMVESQDGAHGLRAWRKQRFYVVITDCNMPIMNGYCDRGVFVKSFCHGSPIIQ